MSSRLTLKQKAFVAAYLETGNATEAYRRAYDCSNMTEKSINENASKLLKNAKVAPRLHELQERAAAKVVLSRAWVLERLMRNADAAVAMNDLAASNKALELLGKTDEVGGMWIDRSSVQSDNRHHHTVDPVSAFDGFLEEAARSGAEGHPAKPVPN